MIRSILTTALTSLALAVWNPASASVAPYSIVVKTPTGSQIGTGGLSFNNSQEASGDGEYSPENAPSPSITFTTGGVPSNLLPFTFNTVAPSNPLKVVVVTTSQLNPGTKTPSSPNGQIELLKQGPNVEGLQHRMTGTKSITLPNGTVVPITLAIDFTLTATPQANGTTQFTRNYSIKTIAPNGAETQFSSGRYHIFNPQSVSPLPEPGSLALLLAGAAAGGLLLRFRKI